MQNSSAENELNALERRLKFLLPSQYHDCVDDVSPTSMGSAALKYDQDGRVAWDQIWTSFCHLALAGGPPHRGKLLEPVIVEDSTRAAYQDVVQELVRGISLTTDLPATAHSPGWIGVRCTDAAMANWLVRAIVAENVTARRSGACLLVPAGPEFRVEKEVKNVIVAVAKTVHYWTYHAPDWTEDYLAARLIEAPIPAEVRNAPAEYRATAQAIALGIHEKTALPADCSQYAGWVAIACGSDVMAAWMLRALAVDNITVRREERVIFVPAHPAFPRTIVDMIERAHRIWSTT